MPSSAHDWLNLNSLRAYPLSEKATGETPFGRALPTGVLVDLFIAVPETVVYPCRLSQISFTGRLFSFVVQDLLDVVVAVATVDIDTEGLYITEEVKSPSLERIGSVTLGPGRALLKETWSYGTSDMGADGGLLEPTTCAPVKVGPVLSVSELNHTRLLRGDVKLIPGANIKLEYDIEDNAIEVILAANEAAFATECPPERLPGDCSRTPITRINGETGKPSVCGCDFFIEGEGLVTVTKRSGAIVLNSDTVHPTDLCANQTQGPEGEPGEPGLVGPQGPPGDIICDE